MLRVGARLPLFQEKLLSAFHSQGKLDAELAWLQARWCRWCPESQVHNLPPSREVKTNFTLA